MQSPVVISMVILTLLPLQWALISSLMMQLGVYPCTAYSVSDSKSILVDNGQLGNKESYSSCELIITNYSGCTMLDKQSNKDAFSS